LRATDEELETVTRMFLMPDILGYWHDIKCRYESMGFTDRLSDKDRIEEYDYITRQMNKYISSHQKAVLADDDLVRMLAEASDMHAHAPFEGRERRQLVYFSMRDDWLRMLMGLIGQMMDDHEMEEDDGWQ